jgi:hypothetical protein
MFESISNKAKFYWTRYEVYTPGYVLEPSERVFFRTFRLLLYDCPVLYKISIMLIDVSLI